MLTSRRVFLYGAAALAAVAFGGNASLAQDWKPAQDVEFVVPFAPGGGADIMARVIQKIITEQKLVPVPVNIVNKPGGGGAVGIGYVTASRGANPNTIVLVNGSTQITQINNPNAKTLTEIDPVMNVMLDDFVIFVKADAPWKTAADFANDARSKPAKTFAFASGGTTDAMGVKVLSNAIGAELNNVQFNSGGEAVTALLGGHVHASIGNPIEFMSHLKAGTVRGIGVFRQNRFAALPDVPTLKELGITAPDFQMWRGIGVPGSHQVLGRRDAEGYVVARLQEVSRRQRGVRVAARRQGLRRLPRPPGQALSRAARQVGGADRRGP
jgi:putative tricarboxylic transport membrane protein